MKKAIFSINIGNNPLYFPCIESMKKYTSKYNIDYIVSTNIKIRIKSLYFEKLQFLELFNKGYEQVACIDADIIATPSAINIFDIYSDINKFYAYNETANTPVMDRDPILDKIKTDFSWPFLGNKKRYFNSGVMVLGKGIVQNMFSSFGEGMEISGMFDIIDGDQTYLNYLVAKNNIPFESIDYSFNRMHLGNKDPELNRYKANFIHYAGPDIYGSGDKAQTMLQDYKNLYETYN